MENLEETLNGPERRRQIVGQKTQEERIFKPGVKLGRMSKSIAAFLRFVYSKYVVLVYSSL